MKKHVYKITNQINNKVYIGQTKQNLKVRFDQHFNTTKHISLIKRAMEKYGKENFLIESLYYGEDYNAKEKEYISFYKSNNPNFGYNILPGGEEPPRFYGDESPFALYDEKWFFETVDLLKNSNLEMKDIAKKQGCNRTTLSRINTGRIRKQDNLNYPIRKTSLSKLEVFKIQWLFLNSDLSQGEIAELLNVKTRTVKAIRSGQNHFNSAYSYPLGGEKIKSSLGSNRRIFHIKADLSSNISEEKILLKYNISKIRLSLINYGFIYFEEDRLYPINKNIEEAVETRSLIAS